MKIELKPEQEEILRKWENQYLNSYPITTRSTYLSFIRRYMSQFDTKITQETINEFRSKNMSSPCSAAIKLYINFLVESKKASSELYNIRLHRNKRTNSSPKSLSKEEVEIIVSAMPNYVLKLFTVVLSTLGLRISEGLKLSFTNFNWLEWIKHIDLYKETVMLGDIEVVRSRVKLRENQYTPSGHVSIENTKRGKFRTIPVPPELMVMIYNHSPFTNENNIPYSKAGLVFILNTYTPIDYEKDSENKTKKDKNKIMFDYLNYNKNYYRFLLKQIGEDKLKKKITPHMFRHTAAQYLCNKGMSLDNLKMLLGHSSYASTEVYVKASPIKMEKEFEKLNMFREENA